MRVFYGWRVVAACFVIAAFAWGLGLFGSSVYLQAVTSAYGWPVAEVASAITLFFLVSAAVQRIVGRSIDRWGPRPILLLGTACISGGAALIGQVSAPWQLYPCFVLLGLGWSTLSMTGITTTVAPWFERHQGRSMTLAIMGASVGAIAGVPLLLLAIGRFGLSHGLTVVGLVTGLVLAPLIWRVLRFRGPAEIGQQRDGDQPATADAGHAVVTPPIATSGNRRVLLWSATATFSLGLTVQIAFITHHVTLAEPLLGMSGAGLLVSATGVTAFVGRLVLARIVDRVRVRPLACLVMVAQSSALLAIGLWPTVPVLIGASLVYGYGIGHVTTLGPVVVRREFGAAAFGATYGTAATVIQLTSAFGPMLFGLLRDAFGGYGPGLAIASAVTLAGCFALLVGGEIGKRTGVVR
ncbi:MFS transporter [Reyranella sp.]|uniref:MFS transporter n=1 Tax=Reyranella sp. TaxID=1929291 RepID=UPI002731504B|nr:MFS transporter [Reyranella sp.]MDP2376685.1 MFS transporter [Reyranella sp.]